MPFFSVIIATRNRPQLFRNALQSVLSQDYPDKEIIVVNDSSSAEQFAEYEKETGKIVETSDIIKVVALSNKPEGHGLNYARNAGVSRAKGRYLCFLDDDDLWTDKEHLSRAQAILCEPQHIGEQIDLMLANQKAFLQGTEVRGPIWLEALEPNLLSSGGRASTRGGYPVDVNDLMAVNGFCHLNALVVLRSLYLEVGGSDTNFGWEGDHDLYLRLIDQARHIVHLPQFVARHNIPDVAKKENVTTSISMLEKWLFQLRVFDKASLFARHAEIRAHGRLHKAYTLKKIAEHLHAAGRVADAAYYARQGLGAGPGFKWFLYTLYLQVLSLLRRSDSQASEKLKEG